MAEFLFNGDCEPVDDKGLLTTCFLHNLDDGPVTAADLYKITYDKMKPQLEKDCRWIFEVCREEANKGKFVSTFPYTRIFDKNDDLCEFIKYWENKGAEVTTSVNLRATLTTASLGMRTLNKHHVSYLTDMGYSIATSSVGGAYIGHLGLKIESISWDKK